MMTLVIVCRPEKDFVKEILCRPFSSMLLRTFLMVLIGQAKEASQVGGLILYLVGGGISGLA